MHQVISFYSISSLSFHFFIFFIFSVDRFNEDSALRGLHRLISRSLQALSLIHILLSINIDNYGADEDVNTVGKEEDKNKESNKILITEKDQKYKIDSGSWKLLEKIPFYSLVVSVRVHDDMRKLLVGVLGFLCADGQVQVADRMLDRLTEKCYLVSGLGTRRK